MYTSHDAARQVVAAIEANGTDVASRDDYNIDAIVRDLYDAWGTFDFNGTVYGPDLNGLDVKDPDATADREALFWATVQRHAKD
ncbi:hypothetical protein [Nocardia brasiliensis]|uniref:hypothetical protein n=1 Tax=Nocardia brasiliensis TaxID=37326 RepID=UPI002453E97C|nr:hypothetical protein [Nocardia brasiliensis]